MDISWTMPSRQQRRGRIDAHVEPFVNALGMQDACTFLLAFGGTEVYLSDRPRGNGMIARSVGTVILEKLSNSDLPKGPISVPMGNAFIVRYLRSQGMGLSEIARKARLTTASVQNYLQTDACRRAKSAKRSAEKYGLED
jgi:hypothetical protein